MHPHSDVNCKLWKDCKHNERESVIVLSVLHLSMNLLERTMHWHFKSQPSYFQNQKNGWWPWCLKRLFKKKKNSLGRVQCLTLIFFPMHKWVVEQLKIKFCICFQIMMKLMALLININKNFTTLGSHDPRQWMKIPRSQLQWTLISSHLALYFASTPNF